MTAQLTIEPAPRFGRVARHYFDGHHASYRCTCTAELRRRYLDDGRA